MLMASNVCNSKDQIIIKTLLVLSVIPEHFIKFMANVLISDRNSKKGKLGNLQIQNQYFVVQTSTQCPIWVS